MSAYLCGREFIDQNARGGLEARCGGQSRMRLIERESQLAALHQYAKEKRSALRRTAMTTW
jgi:hypothetical protein